MIRCSSSESLTAAMNRNPPSASAPLQDQPPASPAIKRKLSQPETPTSKSAKHSSPSSRAKPPLTCAVCLKEFTKNAKLQLHLMSHSGERPFKCTFEGCTKAYSRKSHLDVHALSHQASMDEKKPFKCTFGHTPVSISDNSKSEQDHKEDDEEAEEEEDELDDSKSYTSSVSRLVRGGSEAGGRCDARFSSFYHLQRHLKAHTDPLPHKCLEAGCNMSFAKQVQLKKHESVHTGVLPYKCAHEPCERHFATNSKMQAHFDSAHSDKLRYICAYVSCKGAFSKWSLLQAHIKQDHKHTCKTCNATFTTKYTLKEHFKTHQLEDRPVFICTVPECGKAFMTESSRTVHVRSSHEKIRPHKCTVPDCGSDFAHKHLLTRHMRTHVKIPEQSPIVLAPADAPSVDEKPVNEQNDSINAITDLVGHTFRTDHKPYVCHVPSCLKRFRREHDRDRHINFSHPDHA
ncbi:hypothetical protein CcCBS67573_g08212 [Chytriomyces confervae]|uniref:C2H2-type domain-containing protein n=1 Tax=Chytriomyces confervae TaxID=246404 RepID=A0A507EMR2_9FUNG|nr:hypothetical protein CcCBS67573_g08212 [Chytriomyces confervae]